MYSVLLDCPLVKSLRTERFVWFAVCSTSVQHELITRPYEFAACLPVLAPTA